MLKKEVEKMFISISMIKEDSKKRESLFERVRKGELELYLKSGSVESEPVKITKAELG